MFDAELVALSSHDGRAVQDFAAVCRATLHGDSAAASKLHLVAFDVLEPDGDDLRSLPWSQRTKSAKLDGRPVTTLGSPRLVALIGHRIELAYSRIDADGSLREVRISAIDGDTPTRSGRAPGVREDSRA